MKVAILGHKTMASTDALIIADFLHSFLVEHSALRQALEFVVPAVDGVCAYALSLLPILSKEKQPFIVTAVFPGYMADRPPWTLEGADPREAATCASRIVELEQPMGPYAWEQAIRNCYQRTIDYVRQEGMALIFWNGQIRSDTGSAVRYAQGENVPLVSIHIQGDV